MMRAVHEFFCIQGRCREIQLTEDAHYPVLLSIEQMPGGLEILGGVATHAPGLRIKYRGCKQDLLALGCISRERLAVARYGRYEDDPRGFILYVERSASSGHRRTMELSYFAQCRVFASTLPGVRAYCADWLEALTARPVLRLVVDNTRPT
jgi:hypothetical protein